MLLETICLVAVMLVYFGDLRVSITPTSRIYWMLDKLKNKKFETQVLNNMMEITVGDSKFFVPYSREWLDTEISIVKNGVITKLNTPRGYVVNFSAREIGADTIVINKLGKIYSVHGSLIPRISGEVDEI